MKKLPVSLGLACALALATACTTTAEPQDECSAEPVLDVPVMKEAPPEIARPDVTSDAISPLPEVRYYQIADA